MAEHELNKIVDDDGEVFNLRDSTKQPTADRVTAWGSTPSDTKYPSEKLVKNALDGKLPLYKLGSEVPSSQDFVCVRIKADYVSGVNKSQVLLFDITSFADGSIVNNDGAYVGFKGFFIGGKPQGGGEAVCVKICAKIAYTQITTTMGYNTLKSDSIDCGPEVIKKTENGVDKYYLSIFYGATVYYGNCILVGQFLWRKPTSIDDYSYKNGLICEYTPNETYPAGEPFWDRLHTFTSNIHANTSTKLATARKLKTNLARTADSTFDGSANQENIPVTGTLPPGNGGTGKTSAKAAEYNLTTGKSEISDTTSGDDRVVFELASPSESNGVTRGFRKLSTIWTWIKGLLSSESGVNISGSSTSCTGNAATATKATKDSDGNAINATYFKSSGNTTLVSGAATKIGTQNGADVKLTLPTIPSGTQLVYDCGTGSTSTTDFDNALAAYNAGNWVIIHSSGNTYHCVGTYNSGLRFKQIANETASIKVNTLNWTRGSAPSVGTQLEPSMPGHTHSQYVEKSGDTMSGNLTISKGANQGDTKFVASRTDTGTTGWFGVGDGGQNHGVYSESANANTNNDVDKDTKGWVVRTDENGYSSLTGAVNGLFAKDFGASETLRGMKMFRFGYSLDREGDYTHVSATAIIEVRIYYAGVAGSSITMLFNASARGDVGSYYRLQVLSYNNWNLNSVCPVLITREESATAKYMYLGLVGGGPTSTTLRTFNYTEVKVLPLNGTQKFNWSFGWNTNDFNSNTMTMIKPYVYPRAQIGTAIGDAGTPVYVKADGDFGTASGTDVAIALKDAGRADAPVTQDWRVKVGWGGSGVDACAPNGTSTYSAGQTVAKTKHLVTAYEYDGVGYYKDVQAGMVTVGNSERWNGYQLAIQNPGNTPAADTIYIF